MYLGWHGRYHTTDANPFVRDGSRSTGILVRWILEPATRDFELSELIVVTAQTGQEFPDTEQYVNAISPRY